MLEVVIKELKAKTDCISAFLPTHPTVGPRSLEKAGMAERV